VQFTTPANLIGCTLGRSSLRLHEFRALTDHFSSSRIDLQPVQDTRDVFINRFLSISEDFNRAVNSFRQRMEACLTNQLRRRRHARHTPRTSDTADQRKAEGNSRTSEVRILRHLNQPLKAGHSQCDLIEYHRQHGVAPIPSRYPEVAITSAWTIATPTTPRLVAPTARKTANGFRWT